MDKIIEELKLKMTVDTSSLDADGKKLSLKLNSAIKDVASTVEKLNKSFHLMNPKEIKQFEDGISSVVAKINNAHTQLKGKSLSASLVGDINKEAKNIKDVMNIHLKSLSATLKSENKLIEKSKKAEIDLHKKTEEVKLAITVLKAKEASKAKNVQNRLDAAKELVDYKELLRKKRKAEREAENEANKKSFAQKVFGAGETLTKYAFGSVLASPAFAISQFVINTFSDVAKGAAKYSRDMAQIKAITKATDEEMRGFSKSIKDLGNQFGYTAEEGAEAILVISRLGVDAKNLSGVLQSTASFAKATGSSLEKSGELLVNTMNAFGYAYEKSEYVMNQMTATLNASALDVEKYSTILGYVGAAAKENNITFEETNAMLTLLSKNGLKASTAGTSLRKIFGALSKDGKSLRQSLKELSEQNISYIDAVELVGERAANALTILVKNNKALEETGRYIQLNILDTKAQAELMAQLSLVEQIARTWNGALTSAKEFFGSMLNVDTEEMTRSQLMYARTITGSYKSNDISNRDINDVANAMQLSVQQWINSLTNEQKSKLGFGVENQKQLEENFAEAISNYLKNNKLFREFKGTDELANDISEILVSKSRASRAEAFKSEVSVKAREALAEQQRLNKISKSEENKFIVDFIRGYERERDAGFYGLKFSKDDVSNIKQTGVSNTRVKDIAREKYNKANADIEAYWALGDKATEADRIKWKDAEKLAKKLDEDWGFKSETKRVKKKAISIASISDLLEPLKVSPDIRATLDKAEVISEKYKKKLSETTDKNELNRITKEYFKELEDVRNLITSDNFTDIIESRQNDIEEIKKFIEEADAQFQKDLLEKYKGDTSSIYYRSELTKFQDKVKILRQEIENFDSNQKGVLASARESLDKLIGVTVGIDEFMDKAISFEDTEESLKAITDVMDTMKEYEELRAAGKTYKVKTKYKASISSNLNRFRQSNKAAYEYRIGALSEREKEILSDIEIAKSGTPLEPEQSESFYTKYKTNDLNEVLKILESRLQTTRQGMLTAESIFQKGESKALGVEKTVRTQDREEVETIKNFASERVLESMDMLVDHYKTVQDEMLQAQRERVEAEIENERRKFDTMNSMNSSAVELGLISQQDYALQRMRMEQELYEKENALMREQFENEKKSEVKMAQIKLTQRLAEIALNVLVAESSKGIIGYIGAPAVIGAFSALAMAQSAMEISAINKKEYVPKQFENGGLVEGASHRNGGVPFTVNGRVGYEMEGGEFIVKKSEVARNLGTLKAINNGSFNSSSYYSNSDEISLKLDALIEASNKPVRAYVTSGDLQKNARARVIIGNKTQL